MQQSQIRESTKNYKLNSYSVSHYTPRSTLYPDRNNTHTHKSSRSSYTVQHNRKKYSEIPDRQSRKPKKLASSCGVSVNDTKDEGEEHWWNSFTDGSKSEQGVGSGVAIFTGMVLAEQFKFKLDDRCSNNQAEQLAIVKALEVIETQQVKNNDPGRAVIYTDSKIALYSIIGAKNHEHLVEEIRKRTVTLNKMNWKITFKWVKAHAGIYGNEIADRLAKETTQNH